MTITGSITSIIFRDDENGYTVFEVQSGSDTVVAVAYLLRIKIGERMELTGEMKNSKYGQQLEVKTYKILPLTSITAIEKYISSGFVYGVGPKTAKKIVDKYKEKSLEVIEFNPSLLEEIKGISSSKALLIGESYKKIKMMEQAVMYLQGFGVSPTTAIKVYKTYGENSIQVLNTNPYRLIDDIDGIGFKTADYIATSMGISKTSAYRIKAGVIHVLKENGEQDGNTFLSKVDLISKVIKLISADSEQGIEKALEELEQENKILLKKINDVDIIVLRRYYVMEKSIADQLCIIGTEQKTLHIDIDDEINQFERDNKINLNTEQRTAVERSINNGISVITGGPGTGKTTILNCILFILKRHGLSIALSSPTGRAAKRASEATGHDAKTIHRLLQIDMTSSSGKFVHNEENPLTEDVIVVDEISMVDIYLFSSLLKATTNKTKLILVGDKDQLPSVGAGNILADILISQKITTTELKEIYRQSEQSSIVLNAHLINEGKMPVLDNRSSDFFFEKCDDGSAMLTKVLELVCNRLPKYINQNSDSIQVLAPIKKGICGVNNLNEALQNALNPPKQNAPIMKYGNTTFRVGDKVMHTQNNYDLVWEKKYETGKGVFNGEMGRIIDIKKNELTIEYDDEKVVVYQREELDELVHSYAISVHKSQGSEFDYVILVINAGGFGLMNRNLLYTAVTRAKKMVVIVGKRENIFLMIKNNKVQKRNSMLKYFLEGTLE